MLSSSRVKVSTTLGPAKCATEASFAEACAAGDCPDAPGETLTTDVTAKTYSLISNGPDAAPAWLVQGLSGAPIWCVGAPGAPASKAQEVELALAALPPSLEIDGGIDPDSGAPNTLVWGGWQATVFSRSWQALGATVLPTDSCDITPPGSAAIECHVSLVPGSLPGTFRVSIAYSGPPIVAGSLAFKVHGYAFHADIHACAMQASAALPSSLFAGANLQTLELSSSPQCLPRLASRTLRLSKADLPALPATVQVDNARQVARVTLIDVPDTVVGGTWHLEDAAGVHLADVALKAVPHPITVRETDGLLQLGIAYDLPNSKSDLDRWHDGKSRDGMAVVTAAKGDNENYAQNTAALTIDPQLMALAAQLKDPGWQPTGASTLSKKLTCDSHATTCEDLDAKYGPELDCMARLSKQESAQIDECHRARRAWRVKAHTWEESVWLREGVWWRNKEDSFQDELGGLTFAVFAQHPEPFVVAVELVDYDPKERKDQVLFRQYVKLANGARYESVPLPLADALYVECGHHRERRSRGIFPTKIKPRSDLSADVIRNGYTRAVEDSDVLSGNCRLHYSPSLLIDALQLDKGEIGLDLLKYYGTQELNVTVRRGEAQQTFPFRVDPTLEKEIELTVPRDAKNTTGIYAISVSLKGPALPAVTWRTPQAPGDGTVSDGLGDLTFHANLRPRGPFGWKVAPIRAFLTLPISFTGVRFPARPSELSKSSNSANAQISKIEAGALLAIEPWSYDTGRNPWPVPTRFVSGLNLYNVSEGKFVPSWVTGVSLTLPLIDLQKGITEDQLSTDVALGFFWEADVTEHDWLTRGNHLLVTLGVNVLSLFGSK
jgi:hypothetical protein